MRPSSAQPPQSGSQARQGRGRRKGTRLSGRQRAGGAAASGALRGRGHVAAVGERQLAAMAAGDGAGDRQPGRCRRWRASAVFEAPERLEHAFEARPPAKAGAAVADADAAPAAVRAARSRPGRRPRHRCCRSAARCRNRFCGSGAGAAGDAGSGAPPSPSTSTAARYRRHRRRAPRRGADRDRHRRLLAPGAQEVERVGDPWFRGRRDRRARACTPDSPISSRRRRRRASGVFRSCETAASSWSRSASWQHNAPACR